MFLCVCELFQTRRPIVVVLLSGLEARKRGVMVRPLGNVVVLMPPLSIQAGELKTLCRVVKDCISKVTAE